MRDDEVDVDVDVEDPDEDDSDGPEEQMGSAWHPIWWDTAERVRIELHDGKRVDAHPSDIELLLWGVSVSSGLAWPWHMVRAIHARN